MTYNLVVDKQQFQVNVTSKNAVRSRVLVWIAQITRKLLQRAKNREEGREKGNIFDTRTLYRRLAKSRI